MEKVLLKQVKVNHFFTFDPCEEPHDIDIWMRGNYNKTTNKFQCCKFVDPYHFHEFSLNRIVYTDFIF